MGFNRLNNIVGWVVFLIATTVYVTTGENTASFWDCGEFIAVSYKLMVPHPPGAPFFLLVGRMFSFLALGDPLKVAYWINILSALCSSFSILFLFWTITLLARRIAQPKMGDENNYSLGDKLMILGAGAIGALAYTFSDSFWFSAVEAEVYGMSSFFSAIVVWAIFKWERIDNERDANRWLIFIAYLIGLSIGVHLLNLLAIPALAYVYYFKKYKAESQLGWVLTGVAGLFIVALITYGVIPGLPSVAAKFELAFVNTFGLPFSSGALFFTIAFVAALVWGIFYSVKKKNVVLNTALLSFAFIMIGYSSYALILVRSNANPPIDENNPEDVMTFISYLKREQYGSRPLVYGHTFASERVGQEIGAAQYRKGEEKYEIFNYDIDYEYEPGSKMLFPRIYSQNNPSHPPLYREKLGLAEGEKPTFGDNIYFFFSHQLNHMYFRYFMWNFAGRQSDDKEAGWLSPFEDVGVDLPTDLETNKARDNFYMLPVLLGLLGLFFQSSRDPKGWWVTFLLFFIMGIGLVLYLNSPPVEPRERDYVYVGSFYAFAIWIGLGVMAIATFLRKFVDGKIASSGAIAVALVVPTIMGVKGWDNHNRTGRFLSVDQARNTLAACEPNAILFTGGDNDTFPLWYVQDVEGFRTDVRVAVLSYFSTDWYADQMTSQMNDSPPIPLSLEKDDYIQGKNDYLMFLGDRDGTNANPNQPINLKTYLKLLKQEDQRVMVQLQDGGSTGKLLSRKFALEVDKNDVLQKGFIPKGKENRVVSRMEFDLKGNNLYKNDLLLLDLIATNDWERPIYFNNTSANTINFNLREYLQMDGMVYRLMPIEVQEANGDLGEVNFEEMKKAIEAFQFRGMQTDGYYDDEYKKFGAQFRQVYFRLAQEYFERGQNKEAIQTMDTAFQLLPVMNVPYSYYEPYFVQLYHLAEADDKAIALADDIATRASENLKFVYENKLSQFNYDDMIRRSSIQLRILMSVYRQLDAMTNAEIERLSIMKQQAEDDPEKMFTQSELDRLNSLQERQKIFSDAIQRYDSMMQSIR